jgi:glycosyltransferase involved in cell wall biosynthesis
MPKITVIIPIYNTERYLSEALQSIARQTYSDFEVLLFDDGSTDRSVEIARNMVASDSRFVLHGGKHEGYTHWLNTGVELAKSELIARMDADDIAIENRFERQVCFLEKHRECCLVGTQAYRIDPEGLPINRWVVAIEHNVIDGCHINGTPGGIIHPTVMMRTCAAKQVGGYRRQFEPAEDYDFFLRMAELGRVTNSSEYLLRYRVHAGSVTISRAEAQHRGSKGALEDAWQRRGMPGPAPSPNCGRRTPSVEELHWYWARSAFSEGNFATSKKYASRLLRNRPRDARRWVLFFAASLGPAAFTLRRLIPYRIGDLSDQ